MRFGKSLWLGAALAVSFPLASSAASPAPSFIAPSPAPMDTAWRRLMAPAGFRSGDFDLLVNFRTEIPRTLPVVENLLRHPRSVDSLTPALRAAVGGNQFPASLWPWLDVAVPAVPSLLKSAAGTGGLRPHVRSLETALTEAFQAVTPEERAWLRKEAPGLWVHGSEDTSLDPVATEVERLRSDALIDSVMRVADKIRFDRLARASVELEQVRSAVVASARQAGPDEAVRMLKTLRAEGVPVEIGTNGNDVHRLDHGIVFDPGGDDQYVFPDSARPGSWLLVIDLAGNDTYLAKDSVGGAAAFLSGQIVDDEAGDDRYLGRELAFGSAVMGYSHLYDGGGDDVYEARCASLGFAFHGIGLLEDVAGNDLYSSWYFSQGAASTRGFALLLDHAGNDQYLSRPVFPDDLRYRDHFLSLSQGFTSGFAPRYAGGIGVLWDQKGEDTYSADIFGQGAGYWFGWGLLMDDEGNDKFLAYQYAQGAGVHFAVGTLWDKAGNDLRASKGVSQGCGHDGGFGLLVDEQGNDQNAAVDMSAGAGSANGLGVFLDFSGSDRYDMGNPRMTLGHGDQRRDRGSMGFFLDLGGRDAYPARTDTSSSPYEGPRNDAAWRVYDGKMRGYGYGMDGE